MRKILAWKSFIFIDYKLLLSTLWEIESAFRDLKYTIGLLDFHSKKMMCIHPKNNIT